MSSSDENIVVIQFGQQESDPSVISINCPDQPGLACDLACVLFEFGLNVVKGDLSKDGQWCLVIFWVTPRGQSFHSIKWAMLKNQLVSACPCTRFRLLIPLMSDPQPNKALYILQTWSSDRLGLLNDMAAILWELEVVIHRMKATTSPEKRAVNIFYITDIRERLHENRRQELLLDSVKVVLGEGNVSCKVMVAGPEWGGLECSPLLDLPPSTSNDILGVEDGAFESDFGEGSGHTQNTSVILDNSLSPAHTFLHISCKDRRGLLYDYMRTLKDFQIQVAFGRLATNSKGCADVELFVLEADGNKIVDPERQNLLSCRLELEIVQPIKVLTRNRGPDLELLVATPIELSERGRPKVLQDTTSALRELDLGIFQANLGRRIIGDRKWDIYRFLITERPDFIPSNDAVRSRIREQTKKILVL